MPTTTVQRAEFLSQLEQVQPGLATLEIVDQATCFAFQDGKVYTFNEFVACQADSGLPNDFTGAVQSRPLLDILKNLPDKELMFSNGAGVLKIKGFRKKCRIKMQREVKLPVHRARLPDKWKKLPGLFCDAAKRACQVVLKKDANPTFTSVHVTPTWIESCTSTQCVRYKTDTGFPESVLLRGASLQHVADMGVSSFAMTDEWVHFRTPDKTVLSCRRFHEKYVNDKKDASEVIARSVATKGKKTTTPRGMDAAAKAAKVFAAETDDKLIRVIITKENLKVIGDGVSGEFEQNFKIKYDGPPLNFVISPDVLTEIAVYPSFELTDEILRVKTEKWTYVTSLEKRKRHRVEDGYKENNDGDDD